MKRKLPVDEMLPLTRMDKLGIGLLVTFGLAVWLGGLVWLANR